MAEEEEHLSWWTGVWDSEVMGGGAHDTTNTSVLITSVQGPGTVVAGRAQPKSRPTQPDVRSRLLLSFHSPASHSLFSELTVLCLRGHSFHPSFTTTKPPLYCTVL